MLVSFSIALNSGLGGGAYSAGSALYALPAPYERTAIRFSQRNERKPPFSISQ